MRLVPVVVVVAVVVVVVVVVVVIDGSRGAYGDGSGGGALWQWLWWCAARACVRVVVASVVVLRFCSAGRVVVWLVGWVGGVMCCSGVAGALNVVVSY